jgi:histidinol-phosphatase (PHP family)
MIDLHIHTHYSCDSKVSMKQYCEYALEKGISILCFTDHVDYNKADFGYGNYKPQEYFDELKSVQDNFCDKLTILSGIEFSEPHIYKKEFESMLKYPYDFILGSIHYWYKDMFPSTMLKQGVSIDDALKNYWFEIYKAVSFGGFDSLAHFDFPKRYYGKCVYIEKEIEDIFKTMVKNNISLEVNTSSLRKGLNEAMPDKPLLDIYHRVGGKNITIGGDTHEVYHLAEGYSYAKSITTEFDSVIYIKRKCVKEDKLCQR